MLKLHEVELVKESDGPVSQIVTERMRVPGGWLYLHSVAIQVEPYSTAVSSTFVPDPVVIENSR